MAFFISELQSAHFQSEGLILLSQTELLTNKHSVFSDVIPSLTGRNPCREVLKCTQNFYAKGQALFPICLWQTQRPHLKSGFPLPSPEVFIAVA